MLDKCNTYRFQFSLKYVVCIYTYEVLTVLQCPHGVHKVPVGVIFICKIKFEEKINDKKKQNARYCLPLRKTD